MTNIPSFPEIREYQIRNLKAERYRLKKVIAEHIKDNMIMKNYRDEITNCMVVELTASVVKDAIASIKFPISAWQSFKAKYINTDSHFFWKHFPPQYKTYKIEALYPSIELPKNQEFIAIMTELKP